MPQIVNCPGCGKPLWIADPGSGLTTVCSNCGVGVHAADFTPAPPPVASSSTFPVPQRTGGRTALWISVAAGVLLAGAGVVRYALRPASSTPEQAIAPSTEPSAPPVDAWESQNRSRILSIKAEADRLAAEGQLRPALDQYRQIQQIAVDHRPAAEDLRRAIAEAKTAEDRVVDQLLHAPEPPKPAAQQAVTSDLPPTSPPAMPATDRPPVAAVQPSSPPAPPVVPQIVRPQAGRMAVARRAQPPVRNAGDVSDEEIGLAIQRGVDFMIKKFDDKGQLQNASTDNAMRVGLNSLAVYSLLQASLAIKDERLNLRGPLVKAMLAGLKQIKIEGGPETYAHALRATALAVFNRPEDHAALKMDVDWLLKAANRGAYTYGMNKFGGSDNSNSQYGLLGVWAGAEVGIEVPQNFWQAVENHWAECQLPDGQWGYSVGPDRSGFAMDCAGIASLFVTHDYLDAMKVGTKLGRPPFSKPLEKAMGWMEQGDHSVNLATGSEPWFVGYNLYGLERVGLASGMKHLGTHDWYRELTRKILDAQDPNGSWRGLAQALNLPIGLGGADMVLLDQAYVLLFLSRGRHPVMYSKLRFDGYWANRPRDVANLARYASRELERPLNWQVVGTQRGWMDWMDSPVLYLASQDAPKLTDADINNLRSFTEAGGMLYLNSDGNSDIFNKYAGELAKKLFPTYEMATVPQDHPIYTMVFPMTTRPALRAVSNGSRLLMVVSPSDPAFSWQQRAEKTRADAFQLGLNLFIYASGKSDIRNRLTTPVLPAPTSPATHTVPLARLKYASNWDPEPAAFPRLSRYLWQQTGWGLDLRTIDMAELTPEAGPIAHLTGTAAYTPTEADVKALRSYVEAGGVLVIDCCGGSAAFMNSLETSFLPRAFPAKNPQVVDASHPLLNGKSECASELAHPRIRIGQGVPPSPAGVRMFAAGKGHVIYSPIDITSGLIGTGTANITGFRAEYAEALMKNIILWTEDGQPEK